MPGTNPLSEFEIWAQRTIQALADSNNNLNARVQVLEQRGARRDTTIQQLIKRLDQVEEQFKMVVTARGSGSTT